MLSRITEKNYLSLFEKDPQLPSSLLPTNWAGKRAYNIYRQLDKYLITVEGNRLKLLPVGKGKNFFREILDSMTRSKSYHRMLIHTELPRNIELLSLLDSSLIWESFQSY